MERAFVVVSILCLLVAALFVWLAQRDEAYWSAAFVAATLGVVAWFLRLRAQLRKTMPRDEAPPTDDGEETEEPNEN